MDKDIAKCRETHRRCRHCTYYKSHPPYYYFCKLKSKSLVDPNWNALSGIFCRYYKPNFSDIKE